MMSRSTRFVGQGRRKAVHRAYSRVPLLLLVGGAALASCGGGDRNRLTDPGPIGGAPSSLSVIIDNQVPLPLPCTGPSLTFFEGTTPVDIAYQSQQTVQVEPLFGGPYEIGFQVNGWYWRTCASPGDCPNPKKCQNPDNAGQVGIQVAADCSSATLLTQWDVFTCDSSVPDASSALTVSLLSSNPCTVAVASTASPLMPTDGCCSCSSCTGNQIPAGQVLHCD